MSISAFPDIPLTVGYLDIEVYSGEQGMPDPEKDQVTCFCLWDGQQFISAILDDIDIYSRENDWAIAHFSSESQLLKFLDKVLYDRQLDIISGWNIPWDLEYLEKRTQKLGLRLYLDGTNQFDLLPAYRNLYRRRSYRLKDVVVDEGLSSEHEQKVNYGKLWKQDKPGLLERNKRHTQWVRDLDSKLHITDYYLQLRELAGLEELDTFYPSVLFETMLLRRSPWVLPSKGEYQKQPYEGALVTKPEAGVFKDVAVFDLSRFYPSVMIEEMLDPKILHEYRLQETDFSWDGYKKFALRYVEEGKPTILLSLVSEMIEERKKLQLSPEHEGKLAAIKATLNASYGVSAHTNFRLFTPEIPERVTEVAREILKELINRVEILGYKVIYADTDSIFLQLPKDTVVQAQEEINQILSELGDYEIKLEHYFSSILFSGAKKRYVGLSEDGELHTTGFEERRSDSSNFSKEIQREVIMMMLVDEKGRIIPYLMDKIARIKECKLRDIAITKTLSRDLDKYEKQEQNYIKACRDAKWMRIKAGDAVNVVPAKNYPYEVACFQDPEDLPRPIDINWDKVVQAQIEAKVRDLLPIVGLNFVETTGQGKLL